MLKKITPLLLLLCSFELFAAPLRLAPVAEDDFASVVVSISPTTTINIGNNDRYGSVFSIQGSTLGQYGQIQLSGNSATYTLYQNPTNAALAAGQIVTDTFNYTYTSDIGQSDSARIVIQVTGNQRVPVAVDDYASVTVGVNDFTTVNLTSNDLYGTVVTIDGSTSGQYGYLSSSIGGSGIYSYTLFDNDTNSNLASGQVVEDVFTYTYANELGQKASARFIVKVTGNKQAPIALDDYASVVVGVSLSISGDLTSNDRNGSIATINGSTSGRYGLLQLLGTSGIYTYTLYDNDTNSNLADGQTVQDIFTYTYTNDLGQSTTALLTVNVTGNKQAPIAVDDFASVVVTETFEFTTVIDTNGVPQQARKEIPPNSVSGNLTSNDRNGSIVTLDASAAGTYGFLKLDDDKGGYTYTLYDNDTNRRLTTGTIVTDVFVYTYSNDVGQSTKAKLTIQVAAGDKQPPTAVDDFASVVVGVIPTATGDLSTNDRNGDIITINGSTAGLYGFLALDTNGEYTYTLYDNDTNANLAAGQTFTDTFTYTYASILGESTTARLIVQITRNDPRTQPGPIAVADFASVVVGVTSGVAGNLLTNDRNGNIITLDATTPGAGKYGYLTLSDTNGEYIYTLYDQLPNVDLSNGKTVNDVFTYILANDLGQSVKTTLTVTISNGPRQSPVAVDDVASVVVDVTPTASGNLGSNDRYGSIITLIGSPSGQYGFLQLNGTSGAYIYTLKANIVDADLAAGKTVTDVFTYDYANEFGQKSAPAKLTVNITSNQLNTEAVADSVSLVPNTVKNIVSIEGNVSTNDRNGGSVSLAPAPIPANPKNTTNLPAGEFGTLVLNADGSFVYTLNVGATNVIALTAGQVVYDTFTYVTTNEFGQKATANLTVTIIGNPVDSNGNTIFEPPVDEPLDNVDVEFNNRSIDATPLNSGRNIKGSLYDAGDKDWYYLSTFGNEDQVIKLDLCPVGSSCYGKKSWVVYVFDSAKLTKEMEEQNYTLERWVDRTGNSNDMLGNDILNNCRNLNDTANVRCNAINVMTADTPPIVDRERSADTTKNLHDRDKVGTSNHMYLAYETGVFEGALIGVIDPCFDNLSTLDIGVGKPSGSRNYFIAVSSTLMGSNNGVPAGQCGVGTVALRRPSLSASGLDEETTTTGTKIVKASYTTTEEYISAFPFSDDQYTINITGLNINPLDSTTVSRSATFNSTSGALNIPRLRIAETLYSADLTLQPESTGRSANTDANLKFALAGIEGLAPEQIVDAFRATYNRVNQQVLIPRVTDTVTGNSYSVVMQYHQEAAGNPAWLEVIDYVLIQ